MTAKVTHSGRAEVDEADADIDRFLSAHHDEIAAQLAAGRGQIARGEAAPLEPLDELLRDARERAAR